MYNFNPYSLTYPTFQQSYSQPTQDERIWVQNESSADAYLVAPNGFVRLWDAQKPVFYEKRADATGRPLPLETYKYEKIAREAPNSHVSTDTLTIDYKKEIEALNRRIDELEKELKNEQTTEPNADDTAISTVSEELPRRPQSRSRKADC